MRFTGITPRRPSTPRQRRTVEVNCPKCNVTIDHSEYVEEAPVLVLGCPNCDTVFNINTREVLAEDGKFIERLQPNKK